MKFGAVFDKLSFVGDFLGGIKDGLIGLANVVLDNIKKQHWMVQWLSIVAMVCLTVIMLSLTYKFCYRWVMEKNARAEWKQVLDEIH